MKCGMCCGRKASGHAHEAVMIRFGCNVKKQEHQATVAKAVRRALGTRSLIMIGLMGCGKSSIGRRLARRLELPFVDGDDEIEAAAGKTIAEIFDDHGEADFREGERKVIARLLSGGPQVLATGGGAYMNEETRDNIAKAGLSVWLKADLPILMQRVRKRSHRPLLRAPDPEAIMRDLMAKRYPVYALADVIIESRDEPHEAVIDKILAALSAGPLRADTE